MKTENDMDDKDKLAYLDDLVIAEILSMPEDELRSSIGDADIDAVKSDLQKAKRLFGKANLAQAKAELTAYRSEKKVVTLDDVKAAAELRSLRSKDKDFDRKLTMAARNAAGDADADAAGIEEDLAELDALESEGGKDP